MQQRQRNAVKRRQTTPGRRRSTAWLSPEQLQRDDMVDSDGKVDSPTKDDAYVIVNRIEDADKENGKVCFFFYAICTRSSA